MSRPEVSTQPVRRERAMAADGTPLGWLSLGEGPGLVIVHGAMQSARSQLDLARLLAADHEVHLVDRRGRGLSGPYPATGPYLPIEVDDLTTVLRATGAGDVLGISSGALIALRAALSSPNVGRVAAFEPPLAVDGSIRLDLIDQFNRELAAGDLADAMVTAMLAAELGPPIMSKVPRRLLRMMSRAMLRPKQDRQPDEPEIRELVTALAVDFAVVTESAERGADFAAITQPTLLLDGTRTRPYLRQAVATLAAVIPGSRRVTLDSTDHGVTQNAHERGKPDRIIPALKAFFR